MTGGTSPTTRRPRDRGCSSAASCCDRARTADVFRRCLHGRAAAGRAAGMLVTGDAGGGRPAQPVRVCDELARSAAARPVDVPAGARTLVYVRPGGAVDRIGLGGRLGPTPRRRRGSPAGLQIGCAAGGRRAAGLDAGRTQRIGWRRRPRSLVQRPGAVCHPAAPGLHRRRDGGRVGAGRRAAGRALRTHRPSRGPRGGCGRGGAYLEEEVEEPEPEPVGGPRRPRSSRPPFIPRPQRRSMRARALGQISSQDEPLTPSLRARRVFEERLSFSPRQADARALLERVLKAERAGQMDEAESLADRLGSM